MPVVPVNRSDADADSRPNPRSAPISGSDPRQCDDAGSQDYEVGYGKPPRHTRWKKGQSGNPGGRTKGARGLNTLMREIGSERIIMRTTDGEKRVTRVEAMLRKLMEQGFGGEIRATLRVLELYAQAVPDLPESDANAKQESLTESDRKTLADFRALIAAEMGVQIPHTAEPDHE